MSTARTDYSRNGRIQTRVRRVLIVRGKPMSTTELRLAVYGRPFRDWQRKQIRESAARFCERFGHRASRGKPVLWRLK
jgi:hypothetical protein